MGQKGYWIGAISLVVALALGIIVGRQLPASSALKLPISNASTEKKENAATLWTCSMHPQVKQPKPGKCPICFMDLIPVKSHQTGNGSNNTSGLQLSPAAEKLAEVETAPVERKAVKKVIRMVGTVDYDESKMAYITARMPGRIDVLYVNYTGISVRKGDHMVGYYSPELYVAQKELLQSEKALKQMRPLETDKKFALPLDSLNEQDIMNSVIKKLKLWGLTEKNIETILKTGQSVDLITLYAPISGIVIHKNAFEGEYLKTGDRLFTIADLSRVWIKLEAYESDISWLRYGQKVEFTTESYPGEKFEGRISFIDPFLDKATRTVMLRVDAANPDGKLKPNMFVTAMVYSNISMGGKVIDPELADKWISPMHPEIIKDKPGKCDICGMPLVKASALGYEKAEENELPLVIPASAPLITGNRAVVYINDKPGHFYGQEVVLGPRAGNYYIVKAGLKAGENVVVNGNFKIDSALQIQAKPSMMGEPLKPANTDSNIPSKLPQVKISEMFKKDLQTVYSAYFKLQKTFVNDDFSTAKATAGELNLLLEKMHGMGLSPDATKNWHELKAESQTAIASIAEAADITQARAQFSNLSATVYRLTKQFGTAGTPAIYRFHCPMAFDNKGAYWLQDNAGIENPYFGKVMLKCGEKMEEIAK
ncbi:MAG: efflux RND transporter periplasmic adaptor subunit [Victivallaceae bacterium]